MSKLHISKTEEVAEVVERILGEEDSDCVLVVPKGSVLGKSVSNFHLIKREADSAGKTVVVESVDENILAFAKASEIGAAHPLFEGPKTAAFSDIAPKGTRSESGTAKTLRGRKARKEERPKLKTVSRRAEEELPEPFLVEPETGKMSEDDAPRGASAPAAVFRPAAKQTSEEVPRDERIARSPRRRVVIAVATAAVLGLIGWVLSGPLARATVTINFEKIPWKKDSAVLADASVSGINFEKNILPAELFSTTKNLTHLFPASSEETVSEKAKGRILIYNAFSSAPQTLVATTRFEAPDGKIFRIVNQVTVPGAVVKDGKITPSNIEADIVADKAGPDYNVGPIARLSVPGFKGTPRYQGFYGETKEPAKGGFVGVKKVPTAEDIKNAKARIEELLRGGLEAAFLAGYPKEFKILDGASRVDVTRLNVDASTDEKGNFSIFGEARIRAVGFRDSDLRALLEVAAQKTENNSVFKELELSYGDVKPDLEKGTLNFSADANGSLWPKFDQDGFKAGILGRKIDEARSLAAALPRFAGGKVAVWPIWLRSLPADPKKVKIITE